MFQTNKDNQERDLNNLLCIHLIHLHYRHHMLLQEDSFHRHRFLYKQKDLCLLYKSILSQQCKLSYIHRYSLHLSHHMIPQ